MLEAFDEGDGLGDGSFVGTGRVRVFHDVQWPEPVMRALAVGVTLYIPGDAALGILDD
jgi:hypothetical protein